MARLPPSTLLLKSSPAAPLFRFASLPRPLVPRLHGSLRPGASRSSLAPPPLNQGTKDRKRTRLNSSHVSISYAVFCLKKKKNSLRPGARGINNIRNRGWIGGWFDRSHLSFSVFVPYHPSASRIFFFFNDTATTEIYTLSLHDALPICLILHLGNLFLIVQLHFSKLFLILKSGVNHTSRGSISTSTLPSIKLRKCSSKIITSILSFISGRLATKSNQIKQLIRNGRSASLQRTFNKASTSFSHSTRNKTRNGLIKDRNSRAWNS